MAEIFFFLDFVQFKVIGDGGDPDGHDDDEDGASLRLCQWIFAILNFLS